MRWKHWVYIFVTGSVIGVAAEQKSCTAAPLSLPLAAGGWKLAGPQDCFHPVPARFQVWRGTAGARQVCRGDYDGPTPMTLTVFDMPESPGATAFDAFQKFHIEPGNLPFFSGRFFGVAQSRAANMNTLNRFIQAAESALQK